MGDTGDVAAYLAAHDGVITATQAIELGLTRRQIQGRIERGEWSGLARGVYRSAANDFTEAAMVRAAVLAHRGVADRTTAAWWHGMVDQLPTHLTLSCRSQAPSLEWPVGVRAVRRVYRPESLTRVRGLSLTHKPLTALMTAVELAEGTAFLDRMLQTRQVRLADLERALTDHAGLVGIREARGLVRIAGSDSESEAERLFARLLRQWRLDGWVQQFPTGRWRLDFAWPDHRLAVEISGWSFHRDPRRHGNDLAKANHLQSLGWRELQFNWHMINDRPSDCIQQVIDALNHPG
ncbi:type IV toxin-antitoxin system AbiEi family antitoxin domain-containing protein [Gordonia cholesterolivorans]|uniref:Type IV toxin-antitoxin system AbiEi family antitoxin domain-containing protein n=1 Tax=Gordonia cholesterolivorans TaxID=559625 RepID=A0ABN3HJX4_9ACTN